MQDQERTHPRDNETCAGFQKRSRVTIEILRKVLSTDRKRKRGRVPEERAYFFQRTRRISL